MKYLVMEQQVVEKLAQSKLVYTVTYKLLEDEMKIPWLGRPLMYRRTQVVACMWEWWATCIN